MMTMTPSSARRTGSYRSCAGRLMIGDEARGTGKRAGVVETTAAVVVCSTVVVVAGGVVLRWLSAIEVRRRRR